MTTASNTRNSQLNINFGGENPLCRQLREGTFSILVEFNTPLREQPFASAIAPGQSMARLVRQQPLVTAMAVTDRLRGELCHDAAETATALAEAAAKPVLLHLSGKGSTRERMLDLLAAASSAGIRNVLAVTGDRSDQHPLAHGLQRVPKHPVGYLDSIDIIRLARESKYNFFVGAGVNPYKYNPADQYLQYYKMLRKIASGADFIVTQSGWDMKKLQELQWFLQMRDVQVPVIARLPILSTDEISRLPDRLIPGVTTSRALAAAMERESDVNATQSLVAQLQRIALQAVGCKLLGYSGIQITGTRDEQTLAMVLAKITEAMTAIKSYSHWTQAWNDYHSTIDFTPSSQAYYMFSNLLTPDRQMYKAGKCPMTTRSFPPARRRDRTQAALAAILNSKHVPPAIRSAVQALTCHGCRQPDCSARYCFNLCPATCPKQLTYGACGGSGPEGLCEFGHTTCFFHRVLAVAAERHQLSCLEEAITP